MIFGLTVESQKRNFPIQEALAATASRLAIPGMSLEEQLMALKLEEAWDRLKKLMGDGVRVSPDIAVDEDVILNPGEVRFVSIILAKDMGPFAELDDSLYSL